MNVYDFDGTVYRGDSTVDFYLFCLRRQPSVIRFLPVQIKGFVLYKTGKITKTAFKEQFFSFLTGIVSTERLLKQFSDKYRKKLEKWYLDRCCDDDVIISASPEFLLSGLLAGRNVTVIASQVDIKNGKFIGENCYGDEKARRFKAIFGDIAADEFYSDSCSDAPMAKLAKRAFIVKNGRISVWESR